MLYVMGSVSVHYIFIRKVKAYIFKLKGLINMSGNTELTNLHKIYKETNSSNKFSSISCLGHSILSQQDCPAPPAEVRTPTYTVGYLVLPSIVYHTQHTVQPFRV